ncbi:MAG: hypothetical protein ACLQSR_15660 [Limisphaerales bacterium]
MNTFCKHLRNKKMYIGATPEEALAEKQGEYVTACHFWCNRTQREVGLDDRLVNVTKCQPGRSCFEE